MKNRMLTLAGALALLTVLGKFYAVPAIAQIRAAVIKNIDEKGRVPYMQSGAVGCGSQGLCDLIFPAVPANKRLVLEHVSGNFNPNPGAGINGIFLEGAGGFAVFSLPGSSMATPEIVAVNQPVLAFFEAGQTPFIRVAWSSTTNTGAFTAVVSGYLVDLTQ
ncbi:MAG TPA: hypothetical protein VKU19_03990 [Bryobacteraceae bacterium]|nr:hypothetical protein [Bryobacteraceae bacterium]